MLEREDLRQVRSVIKDVLREDHLDKLPDLFGREHHKHRGTHDLTFKQLVDAPDYIDNRQFITVVNEDEDGIAFVDLLGTDHQVVVTKNPEDITLSLHHQVHIYSDEEAPRVRISNLSDTLELDPVLQFGKGSDGAIRFTAGVDDSDSDAWLLCSGDILTSVAAAEETNLSITYDGTLLVADTNNNRIKRHLSSDAMTYVSKIGSSGSGNDQFSSPWSICTDGWYVYVADTINDRIVKRLLSDLSYVAKVGSTGSGNDQFNAPRGIITDGVYLYIADSSNQRIVKRLCSDLSFVSKTDGTEGLYSLAHVCTDGKYLYTFYYAGATYIRYKLSCSTLGLVQRELTDGQDVHAWNGMCYAGGYIYATTTSSIHKYTSGLVYVSEWGAAGTGDGQFTSAGGIATDGVYLWITDMGGVGGSQRIQKFLLDGTFVAKYGTYGSGDAQFYIHRGICMSGTISGVTTIPYRAPILKAGLDGSYVDSFPVHRFRDQIQLMEDGVVGAVDYIGINAPAAITASYNITLPAADPSAQGHFAISTAGVVTWGQNVGTTGSPTFVRITSLSVAIGTAPITVTSTTVCPSLNADLVDGKHEAAFVLVDGTRALTASWDVGSFEVRAQTFQSDVVTGTAPFTVASITAVTNLNADLLDGSHAVAFAAAAHNHSGVYEPVLGNPGTDGWILSSTILGVRSWIAPGGGGGTFITLTDCPASYATHGGKFVKVNAGETALEFVASSVAGHDILSASHGDALAAAVVRGDVIYGNATPKWARLPKGSAGDVLTCDGTDVAWAAPSGGTAHVLLSATHADTLADTVVRGDVLYGNATPKWARLAKGSSGKFLKMGADDPSWDDHDQPVFGNGVDGNVTISAPTTLTSDMYYANLTIDTGITLESGGFRIFVSGTLTLSGTGRIANSGGNGGDGGDANAGSAGAAGSAGTVAPAGGGTSGAAGKVGAIGVRRTTTQGFTNGNPGTISTKSALAWPSPAIGGAGGNGVTTAGGTGTGGAGGAATISNDSLSTSSARAWKSFPDCLWPQMTVLVGAKVAVSGFNLTGAAASGGSGGVSSVTTTTTSIASGGSGGSGAGGGTLVVSAKIITGSGTIQSRGGNGGNGGAAYGAGTVYAAGGSCGGNGGPGGLVVLVYGRLDGFSTSQVTSPGGAGGTGSAGLALGAGSTETGGANGTDGVTGKTSIFH